jgi:hypothetical protein
MTSLSTRQESDEQRAMQEMAKVMAGALARGKNKQEIVEELVRAGWPEESARGFVRRTLPR